MGFFKNIMMKQMMKSQMKGLPAEQQERVLAAVEKDPEFFENIAKQINQKKKQGKGEVEASMEVMRENQDKLRKLMM